MRAPGAAPGSRARAWGQARTWGSTPANLGGTHGPQRRGTGQALGPNGPRAPGLTCAALPVRPILARRPT